ncbi:MAG: GTP-binding protein, partial [Candidatus Thorarchaeota archaeon]
MAHLYKRFVGEKVVGLLENIKNIRNCTVIAHIDHGKTTLTDSLIAASGLLSDDLAASVKLLDYDAIEQQRGITIKASSISLVHRRNGQDFLIHLIDTPGHIDFSFHVTKGLRMADGAIVVVDIVEGIMVQTETVTRQAATELVRPVLFVNKIDRLISEKQYGAQRIASEAGRIVTEFNAMLGKYLPDEILSEWEVSFRRGSLVIGSALDKWGIDIVALMHRAGNDRQPRKLERALMEILEDIVSLYREGQEQVLSRRYPLARCVLDAVADSVPSPDVAQSYRVRHFWRGDTESDVGRALLRCERDTGCIVSVGDVQSDRHAGTVAAVRVMTGRLTRGHELRNLRTGKVSRTLQVGLFMSKTRVPVDTVPAGNLAFITGISEVAIGDTLVEGDMPKIQPLDEPQYPTEPVVTYSVEPRNLADLKNIQEPIMRMVQSDPSLEFYVSPDSGENLLSGAGELHIEIVVEKLAREGVEIVVGKPMVVLKEQMAHDGETQEAGGGDVSWFRVRALLTPEGLESPPPGTVFSDARQGCYLVDQTGTINAQSPAFEWVVDGFKTLIRNGPVSGERMRRLTIRIEDATIVASTPETSW